MRFLITLLGITLPLAPLAASANGNVHVTRFWHNHQPLYWPEWNKNGPQDQRGQYAWDSIVMKPGQNYGGASPAQHPENNLTEIFGINDRVNSYQSGPRNSLANIANTGGFAISYSGSLIDNVRQLGSVGQLGYGSGWNNGYKEARGWKTPAGSTRMDLVGFTYHHSLAPLLPKSVLRKEIQTFKQAWWKAWGGKSDLSDHSKGFFPTEMGYSRHLVDVLADEGYQWVIVASHHISRTCPTYNTKANPEGSYNIFSSPPNKADQLGPSPTDGWWYSEPNPGNAAWNVAPFAYQLHKVKYVNPETGVEKTMFAVPSDDVLSYRYGYANEGTGKIGAFISPFATDPARPLIVMPSTDGDNAWGGGSSSWMEATPQLFNGGYRASTPQDFVNAAASNAPMAHIEDGAWIFPEMCYGSPNFMKWIEPPVATVANRGATTVPGTQIDMETPGFALKFYSYAPLMAGANWCETAEQILRDEGGSVQAWKIQAPYDWDGTWTAPNDVELAWHIFLKGLDSGFNYYGGLGNDDEMKPGLATRRAVEKLTPWMTDGRRNNDRTGPTVLKPQRFPYNPGWYTFGWFNQQPQIPNNSFLKRMNSEFYIWTHAYDLNGIPEGGVTLKIRIDNDGTNPLASNQNETYAGGSEVGQWITVNMTKRVLPKTKEALNAAAANSQINYFLPVQPDAVADYYFAKITDANLPGFRSKLLDYYIEATDSKNNVSKSEIQHVWVDDYSGQTNSGGGGGGGGGGNTSPAVTLSPAVPIAGQPLTVTYNPAGRPLASATAVNIHHGYNQNIAANWTALPGLPMAKTGGNWTFTYNVPANAASIALAFNNGSGAWDNNGGGNWNFSVNASVPTVPPAVPTGLTATATSDTSISLSWNASATAASYTVYRNGNQTGTPQDRIFIDTDLQPETTYSYTVRAVNAAGQSGLSTAVAAKTLFTPLPPAQISILEPAQSSTVNGSTQLFTGRAGSAFTGGLVWTNLSNNATGTIAFPGGTLPNGWDWSASIPLVPGNNTVNIRGNLMQTLADSPANYASWGNGSTGGQGFSAWTLSSIGNGGHFLANNPANMNVGSNLGFGLWANNGGTSTARRDFNSPLAPGDSFAIRFDNNFVTTGSEVGFALADSTGAVRLRFFFVGGQANYRVADAAGQRETSVSYTADGLLPVVSITGNSTYSLAIGASTISGNLSAGGRISRVIIENKNSGPDTPFNIYIGELTLNQLSSLNQNTTVARQTENTTNGLPDSWWIQYFGSTTDASSKADPDGDGLSNTDEYALGSSPTDPNNPASGIAVEDSTGLAVSSNTTVVSLGNALVGGQPVSASLTIRNFGSGYLRNLSLAKDGIHAHDFSAGLNPVNFFYDLLHVDQPDAGKYLVSSNNVRKYSEWQSPAVSYWGPTTNGLEGQLVYKFPLGGSSTQIWLKANDASWDFYTEQGGFGRGCSMLEASRDGVTWVVLENSLNPRQWGVDWSYENYLPEELLGAPEIWIRVRMLVEGSPNSSYTVAQFGRSDSSATSPVFSLRAKSTLTTTVHAQGPVLADPLVVSSIQPGGNATLNVSFAPSSGGNRTARIAIPSNDPDESPFIILLSGFGIGTDIDSDGDGLNDAAEFSMSNLGFDWRTAQPALVGTLSQHAPKAGFYGEGQIRDMNVGIPLLSKNSTTGKFKLTLALEKSSNLGQGFVPMPFDQSGTFLTNDGKLEFEFHSPENAAFFRLKAK